MRIEPANRTVRRQAGRFIVLILAAVFAATAAWADEGGQAKYVFFMIGDGMGLAQRVAAELYKSVDTGQPIESPEARLVMNRLPVQGTMTTHSASSAITDSAAAGTAMACGARTTSGRVAQDADGAPVTTIAQQAKAHGMRVGILATVSIDHATPAVFYAHQDSRNQYYEIGRQLAESPFDFFAGGAFRMPTGSDGNRPCLVALCREKGFSVVTGRKEFDALSPKDGRAVVLFPDRVGRYSMDYEIDRDPRSQPSVAELTAKAIEMLHNEAGFFVMVEGGKIDWACHANDAATAIHDTLAFDDAIAVALEFYRRHPNETLIVVTADHETGGMSVGATLTEYQTHFDLLLHQTMSVEAVMGRFRGLKERHGTDLTFEHTVPLLREAFGLARIGRDERAELKRRAEAGHAEARRRLALGLTPWETKLLKEALATNLLDVNQRPQNEEALLLYGSPQYNEPFVRAALRVMSIKAGVGWTTFSHTAIPVPVSAIGVGAGEFGGYYDITELPGKMKKAMGIDPK